MNVNVSIDLDEGEQFTIERDLYETRTPTFQTLRVRALRFTLGVPEDKVTAYGARIVKSTGKEEQNARPLTMAMDDLPEAIQDVVRSIQIRASEETI